ncbi:MAG TPA: twin-arginine translocase subunit TatC [Pseudomonadales bacterium]|jgi:sec-independent protein translocase protein TatC
MSQADTDTPQPLVAHLTELRARLLRSVLALLALTLCILPFANPLYEWISEPLRRWLPAGSTMIATDVTAPFLVPFKLAAFTGLLLSVPYLLWQAWGFVAPGLYQREKRLVLPLMVSSIALFYSGVAFAFFVVCPMIFGFFAQAGPHSVAVMTDMGSYLNFVLTLFFAFGVAFEIPIATILLIRSGLVSAAQLADKRAYVIVSCFVIGMLLTPPDVISQTMLAVPMWLLFEIGVGVGRYITPRPGDEA